ncbi:hypothetical protein NDU88_005168 [Pleurodeles waltl]|uniref:Uncharacterized protein n=1 Tax=Pleurodeles waltl TaxID=8319 RepID=A0AAV7NLR0_PLEWA|nr:hypothetical protein NDU88_005168 [Pleurodeles waltl]
MRRHSNGRGIGHSLSPRPPVESVTLVCALHQGARSPQGAVCSELGLQITQGHGSSTKCRPAQLPRAPRTEAGAPTTVQELDAGVMGLAEESLSKNKV